MPVVWAVAVDSLNNKLILMPAALASNRFMPGAVTPLLMLGGLYLCPEWPTSGSTPPLLATRRTLRRG